MATIGNIAMMLKVNAKGFLGGMQKASKAMKEFAADAAKFTGIGGAIASVIGGISVGALVAYAKRTIASAAATAKLARDVNSTVEGLTALQYQIKSLGGDENVAGQALADLNEKLGGFGPEAEQARAMMERLGLNFEKLSGMQTDKAFGEIAAKIGGIADPAGRASAAFAIFGDKAAALLPALTQGKKGTLEAAEAARKLGLSFSGLDASKIEDANVRFGQFGDLLTGIGRQFAVQLAPWVLKMVESLQNMGVTGGSVGEAMIEIFRAIAKAVAYTVSAGILQWTQLKVVIQGAFYILVLAVSLAMKTIFRLLSKLPKKMGGDMFKGLEESTTNYAKGAIECLKDLGKEAKDDAMKALSLPGKVDAFFDEVTKGAKAAEEAMKRMGDKTGKGSVPMLTRNKKLLEMGKQIEKEMETPFQKFSKRMGVIKALMKLPNQNMDALARASGKAIEELEKAHGLGEIKLPTGARRESSEALSAINQQDAMLRQRARSPADRLRQVQEQALSVEKQQLDYMRRIADALTAPQTVSI